MAFFRFILLLSLFTSCRVAKIAAPKSLSTVFEGDSLLFDALEEPQIAYNNLSNVQLFLEDLKPHKKLIVFINRPTIFRIIATYYIVYPGENITISIGDKRQTIFKIEGSEQRNREFHFQYAFQTLNQNIWPQIPGRTRNYPIDSILLFEHKVKAEMTNYIVKANTLFDSLAAAYHISDAFKMLSRGVMENQRYTMLQYLYSSYQNELTENNLYFQKQRELLPLYNNITVKQKLDLGGSINVEAIAQGLKIKMWRIKNEDELKKSMDTVIINFKILAKDFLLTKIMYAAVNNNVSISKRTMRYYYRNCQDTEYKYIIKKLVSQKKHYAIQSKRKKDNRIIALSDNKIYTLDEILSRQKGNLILIDVWASWCIPCLKQHPYMERLQQQFSGEHISFIFLSIDKEISKWQQKSEQLGINPAYSYLIENFNDKSFAKKYKIETIPRYLLIGKNGEVINVDAPTPDNIELEKLIKNYL